jgi:hypothetical protein
MADTLIHSANTDTMAGVQLGIARANQNGRFIELASKTGGPAPVVLVKLGSLAKLTGFTAFGSGKKKTAGRPNAVSLASVEANTTTFPNFVTVPESFEEYNFCCGLNTDLKRTVNSTEWSAKNVDKTGIALLYKPPNVLTRKEDFKPVAFKFNRIRLEKNSENQKNRLDWLLQKDGTPYPYEHALRILSAITPEGLFGRLALKFTGMWEKSAGTNKSLTPFVFVYNFILCEPPAGIDIYSTTQNNTPIVSLFDEVELSTAVGVDGLDRVDGSSSSDDEIQPPPKKVKKVVKRRSSKLSKAPRSIKEFFIQEAGVKRAAEPDSPDDGGSGDDVY